jgi:hypothetical protein
LRSNPLTDEDREFHDRLSVTASAYRHVSDHLWLGPEIGYHGFDTIRGLQAGPEWAVDSYPGALREGVWEGVVVARLRGGTGQLHPYLLAGGGPYVASNLIIESREAKIDHRVQPGVTAGVGFSHNSIGLEGRWHYIQDGLGKASYSTGVPRYSYDPLRIYSLSICLYFP